MSACVYVCMYVCMDGCMYCKAVDNIQPPSMDRPVGDKNSRMVNTRPLPSDNVIIAWSNTCHGVEREVEGVLGGMLVF